MGGRTLDESYKRYLTAARVLYVTAKKSRAGNPVAKNELARALEALDRAHLELRAKTTEDCKDGGQPQA